MDQRTLEPQLLKDLDKKVVLLGGPRQVGKTTLSKTLYSKSQLYLNYDSAKDRKVLAQQTWPRDLDLIVMDEIHKMPKWKTYLKGIYDVDGVRPRILVTGSARLDTWKKGSDSLAGRHLYLRLHPFSVAELNGKYSPEKSLELILKFGGFPEPLFEASETAAARWRKSHIDVILRQDMLDLEQIRNIKGIEILVELLAERVGSPVSYLSLARDLQVSPHTIKKWVEILERLFVIFVVTPYSKNIARSILREPKIYFYDTGRVTDEGGARLENTVATALLKRNQFLEDTQGESLALHYLRDKQKHEVDFLVLRNKKPELMIEVKKSDESLSPHLRYFHETIQPKTTVQLVQSLKRKLERDSIKLAPAGEWLSQLET